MSVCFLLWKLYLGLVWCSFVVARASFQHLVLHGLLIVFNLERIIPFFRKQYARKNTNWQNTINASFKSFLYFLISFGCSSLALFCSSSLFLFLFLFKKCFGWVAKRKGNTTNKKKRQTRREKATTTQWEKTKSNWYWNSWMKRLCQVMRISWKLAFFFSFPPFCWTTEGLSVGLQKEVVLDCLSRRVLLSQVWEGSIPASVPTLRVLSQVWEGLSQL